LAREADFATKPSVLGLPAGFSFRFQISFSICAERYIGTDDFDAVSIVCLSFACIDTGLFFRAITRPADCRSSAKATGVQRQPDLVPT
jgi:hypothetical protein